MAKGSPIFFNKLALLITNGGTPPEFNAWCGITSLTKTTNKETGTVNMPDCDDPDLPGWLTIYLISNQLVVSGTGTAALESFKDFEAWDRVSDKRDVQFLMDLPAQQGGGKYEGPALLTQWEVAGENRAPATFSFAVTFDGQPNWIPAA